HFEALEKHKSRTELVSVCDIDPKALEATVTKTGARGYRDLTSMLSQSDCDVVVLCTPSGLHPAHGIEAAKAGKHIVSEKPMATRLEDAKAFVNACDDEGVRLFVVKQNRRNATLQLLKRAVEQGRFGRIYMVNINVFWTRPQEYYDQAKWRGTWELDGGAFMNQASHYVDLLSWLVGPIESLHAYTATLARKIEAEDTGVMNIRWKSGALGSMNVTMLTYPKNLEGSITILGENGTVRIGGVAVNEIQHWEFKDKRPEDESIKAASYETTSVYGHGHPLYYDNVIKTLRGEEEAHTDGRDGMKSVEVLAATYISARDGRRVFLPLEVG
ncbi:MAG: Gfo/Idh/MocA family oxidoreductase, partial [Bdellovibrionota bacterium]